MKLTLLLLVLLGMALNSQLLAPMLMTGCADVGESMHAGNVHAMPMPASTTGDRTTIANHRASGGDCCHSGHTEQCPMTGCFSAVLPDLIVIVSPGHRDIPLSTYLPTPHDQPISTHYRPPIFA